MKRTCLALYRRLCSVAFTCSVIIVLTACMVSLLIGLNTHAFLNHCCDNFLAQRPLADMHRLSGDDFFMFQQDGTSAHQHASDACTVAFMERERDARNALSYRHLCPCMHEFWQLWAHRSWQLITVLNKPYSVFCVLIQASDTLFVANDTFQRDVTRTSAFRKVRWWRGSG